MRLDGRVAEVERLPEGKKGIFAEALPEVNDLAVHPFAINTVGQTDVEAMGRCERLERLSLTYPLIFPVQF